MAGAFFAHSLRGARAPSWMRPAKHRIGQLYGLGVTLSQFFPAVR